MRRLAVEALEMRAMPTVTAFGDTFAISEWPTGSQHTWSKSPQAVAADAEGNLTVTWTSAGQAGAEAVYMRQLWASGVPKGPEVRVNETLGKSRYSSVAVGPSGEFVIVWTAYQHLDGSGQGVFGRYFAPDGQPVGATFQVNQVDFYHQRTPSAAFTDDGEFVVVWADALGDDDAGGIIARYFSAGGIPVGEEFLVNLETEGSQFEPVIASGGPDHSFAVAWTSVNHEGRSEIRAQCFGLDGWLGDEFVIGQADDAIQRWPRIVMDSDGGLLATWSSKSLAGDDWDVYFQRFDALGVAATDPMRVNATKSGDQRLSALTADAGGNLLIAWLDGEESAATARVLVREFAATGLPIGRELASSQWTAVNQTSPALSAGSMNSANTATLVWTAPRDSRSGHVLGQALVRRATSPGDTDGDGDVDLADLNNVRNNFGHEGDQSPGDVTGDGVVNVEDLNEVRNYLGEGMGEQVIATSAARSIARESAPSQRMNHAAAVDVLFSMVANVDASPQPLRGTDRTAGKRQALSDQDRRVAQLEATIAK